jgi:hypothetical protein
VLLAPSRVATGRGVGLVPDAQTRQLGSAALDEPRLSVAPHRSSEERGDDPALSRRCLEGSGAVIVPSLNAALDLGYRRACFR